jgi:hypothetical protein
MQGNVGSEVPMISILVIEGLTKDADQVRAKIVARQRERECQG